MASRVTVASLLALGCAVSPSVAVSQTTTTATTAVHIVRSAGTCPAAIPIVVATTQYEGGDTTDVTARTMAAAFTAILISATRKQIVFDAELRPAYASCEGKGRTTDGLHAFVLGHGRLGYTITLAHGDIGTGTSLLRSSGDRFLDQAAVDAVKRSEFRSATFRCEPVAGAFVFTVSFGP